MSTRSRTILFAIGFLIAFTLTSGPADAEAGSSVYMVGDSITALGVDDLAEPSWTVNGKPGRLVSTLPFFLRGHAEQTVVIALGTNAAPGWTEASYRKAIALLPASTRVVLVTTYRDPAYNRSPDYKHDPAHSLAYTQAMIRIAQTRPHTCVVPWRYWARHHNGMLTEGTHPNAAGQKVWASMVKKAVEACR